MTEWFHGVKLQLLLFLAGSLRVTGQGNLHSDGSWFSVL